MTETPKIAVTIAGDVAQVQFGHYRRIMTLDELRTLRDEINAALGDGCKYDEICERPHANCSTGCEGYGNA